MTTWAVDTDAVWDGPSWAAPEHAERWMHRSAPPQSDPGWGIVCRMMAEGNIDAELFRRFVQIKIATKPRGTTR